MNAVRSHKLTAAVAVLVVVGAVVGSSVANQPAIASQSAAPRAAAIGFAPTTVVDDQGCRASPTSRFVACRHHGVTAAVEQTIHL